MDRTTFWLLAGLIAAFALPALAVAGVSRVRDRHRTPTKLQASDGNGIE